MKKLTAAVAALALFFSASAFGPGPSEEVNALLNPSAAKIVKSEKVGRLITLAFKDQFTNAGEVSWKENQGLYFGYFKQQDQDITVAYTHDGELFAVSRQLKLSDLPEAVATTLKEKYGDYTVTDNVSEVTLQGETGYYVSVENKNSSKLVKILSEGQDEVVKSTRKKVMVGSVM